jgi:hypothetical protein
MEIAFLVSLVWEINVTHLHSMEHFPALVCPVFAEDDCRNPEEYEDT